MEIKNTSLSGWQNNLQLVNEHVELVISLDVGPRILSYKTVNGANVLKNYPEQMGGCGEAEWKIRGGHRLWIAPEHEVMSYVPDNGAVTHELLAPTGVKLVNEAVPPWGVRKEMIVKLADDSSEVTIEHRLTNEGSETREIASWGLSVMEPGGLEIIPLPPLGEHPRDLLPNRQMIVWPYTDMADARWRWGTQFITVRQTPEGGPAKLGLAHTEKWVGYLTRDALFIKTFDYLAGASYPDLGCNFETFTNAEMIEIETLGPLVKLGPGQSTSHIERWYLLGNVDRPHSLQEPDLAAWIKPHLQSVGIV